MGALPRKEDAAPRAGRRRLGLLLSFVVLAVLLAGGLCLRMYSERSGWQSTSTEIGDYRRLPLSDGSTLELNTATEVRYRLSDDLRLLDLVAGEARVRVARDPTRPFLVIAADTVVRAVGTELTVRIRDNGKVDVVVAHGVVAVSHWPRKSAVRELLFGRKVPVAGGRPIEEKRMVTDDAGRFTVAEMTREKVEAHDAWRSNFLMFDATPLSEVVDEFNRYNKQKLEIAGAPIGTVRIGGRYRPRDVEGFLRYLSGVMKIRVSVEEGKDGTVHRIYGADASAVAP